MYTTNSESDGEPSPFFWQKSHTLPKFLAELVDKQHTPSRLQSAAVRNITRKKKSSTFRIQSDGNRREANDVDLFKMVKKYRNKRILGWSFVSFVEVSFGSMFRIQSVERYTVHI